MSADYYHKVSGKSAETNAFLVQTAAMTKDQEDHLSEKLLETGSVTNTSFVSKQIETQEFAGMELLGIAYVRQAVQLL